MRVALRTIPSVEASLQGGIPGILHLVLVRALAHDVLRELLLVVLERDILTLLLGVETLHKITLVVRVDVTGGSVAPDARLGRRSLLARLDDVSATSDGAIAPIHLLSFHLFIKCITFDFNFHQFLVDFSRIQSLQNTFLMFELVLRLLCLFSPHLLLDSGIRILVSICLPSLFGLLGTVCRPIGVIVVLSGRGGPLVLAIGFVEALND